MSLMVWMAGFTVSRRWLVAFMAKADFTVPRVRSHSSNAPGAPPLAKCRLPASSASVIGPVPAKRRKFACKPGKPTAAPCFWISPCCSITSCCRYRVPNCLEISTVDTSAWARRT